MYKRLRYQMGDKKSSHRFSCNNICIATVRVHRDQANHPVPYFCVNRISAAVGDQVRCRSLGAGQKS